MLSFFTFFLSYIVVLDIISCFLPLYFNLLLSFSLSHSEFRMLDVGQLMSCFQRRPFDLHLVISGHIRSLVPLEKVGESQSILISTTEKKVQESLFFFFFSALLHAKMHLSRVSQKEEASSPVGYGFYYNSFLYIVHLVFILYTQCLLGFLFSTYCCRTILQKLNTINKKYNIRCNVESMGLHSYKKKCIYVIIV